MIGDPEMVLAGKMIYGTNPIMTGTESTEFDKYYGKKCKIIYNENNTTISLVGIVTNIEYFSLDIYIGKIPLTTIRHNDILSIEITDDKNHVIIEFPKVTSEWGDVYEIDFSSRWEAGRYNVKTGDVKYIRRTPR